MESGEGSTIGTSQFVPFSSYSQGEQSRILKWAGHLARMEEDSSAFKIITVKRTGKRHLGKPRHRQEDNVKWIFKNRYQYEELG